MSSKYTRNRSTRLLRVRWCKNRGTSYTHVVFGTTSFLPYLYIRFKGHRLAPSVLSYPVVYLYNCRRSRGHDVTLSVERVILREVMSDVFLSTTATVSTKSALFVAWGQLLTYDLSLTADNVSEPFDIGCDDRGGMADVWCPLGAESEEIPFNRSNAAVSGSVRSPVNYATSYIDLDLSLIHI